MAITKSRNGSSSSTTGGSSSSTYGGSNSSTDTYSYGGSDTSSSTYGGSSSSTYGGSSSHSNSYSEGGSQSNTYGESYGGSTGQSASSSVGGSSTTGAGKSWASGQVSDKTQAGFDKYSQEYQQSPNVTDAYNKLQEAMTGKPTFQSTYEDKLSALYDQIMNREKFNYNFNEDQMYQQYKDQYTTQGNQAMQDTMGQAAALTGGYNSSYAQTAGQQTYQNYLQQLNNMIPELRNQAYSEYQQEGQDLLNRYNITNDAYNNEYSQYRNDVSDWQTDRSFNQSQYSDERNFDYGQYSDNRNYWQSQYWNERNAEQSNINSSDSSNYSNSLTNSNSTNWSQNQSTTDSRNWSNTSTDTNSTNWSNTESTNWSNTNSHTDSWNNSHSNTASTNWSNTDSTNWSNTNSSGWSNSSSPDTQEAAKYTADWSHNTAPKGGTSGDLVKALTSLYQTEGQESLANALGDLQQNGLRIGDTQYKFGKNDIEDLLTELSSVQDNIYRYSNGKKGNSYSQTSNSWLGRS